MKTKIKTQEYSRGMIKIITCQNLKIVFHENLVSKSKKETEQIIKKEKTKSKHGSRSPSRRSNLSKNWKSKNLLSEKIE
jgi:hypothetical protein